MRGRKYTYFVFLDGNTITIHDVLGSPTELSSSPLVKELLDMIGLDDVKQSVLSLIQMAEDNYRRELCGDDILDISLHRMFLGNSGTGKNTIAKLYGRILAEMGYLSNGEVIVVGASKLTGSAVGTTASIVNSHLDSAKGKVSPHLLKNRSLFLLFLLIIIFFVLFERFWSLMKHMSLLGHSLGERR
jgi:hypothetical protein